MAGYFETLINQTLSRSREATLSILGVADQGLRQHLASSMTNELGNSSCFLASPVFEHTFGWEPDTKTLGDLEGNLLSAKTLKALSDAPNPEYCFRRDAHPYCHQIHSWQTLLAEKPKSAVITTGTGSGKTECFMVPILEDLLSEQQHLNAPLVGVRALFLYPLNALINSQRERLSAWTHHSGSNIRFCLYNGNTEESESRVRKEQAECENEILSRERLRKEPAPILLTNATMLEYMLVRQVDAPILSISRQQESLRWIVLDEAHTYIGSQAAELSLLLRRVVSAFGKQAHEIRFVATSATIGDADAKARLQSYLASLAGVPNEQVVVVTGNRQVPDIAHQLDQVSHSLDTVRAIDPGESVSSARFEALEQDQLATQLRHRILTNPSPVKLTDLVEAVGPWLSERGTAVTRQQEVIRWLDTMTDTQKEEGGAPFLKLRCHLFQQMLHGLWSCVDPQCPERGTNLSDWPFGRVFVQQRHHCDCNAPVYEIGFCGECRAPHLIAEDSHGLLRQTTPYVSDEFSLQDESEQDFDTSSTRAGRAEKQVLVLAPVEDAIFQGVRLNTETGELGSLGGSSRQVMVYQAPQYDARCHQCDHAGAAAGDFLSRAYLGSPFYVSNAVPTVLEFCPDPLPETGSSSSGAMNLPGRGRKLITFTDSRQGTARMAVRMQQEAERSRLRGLVFQTLRNHQARENQEAALQTEGSPEELLNAADVIEKFDRRQAEEYRKRAAALQEGVSLVKEVYRSFTELVGDLAAEDDIRYSILDYNRYANPQLFSGNDSSHALARLLLLREFARRPKYQNSTETLGLVKVSYRGLAQIVDTPEFWMTTNAPTPDQSDQRSPLTLEDWRDFLKVALDFYVRENTYFRLDDQEQGWMGARFAPKVLVAPSTEGSGSRVKAWPQVGKGSPHRLIKVLTVVSGLDPADTAARDKLNTWLVSAWRALIQAQIIQVSGNGYALSREVLQFSLPNSAWRCPVTNRLIDTTLRGVTPYLPNRAKYEDYRCTRTSLPDFVSLAPSGELESVVDEIRQKVTASAVVHQLRDENLWTDISDRTAEGGFYYRTAEHSAQQSSKRLQEYEKQFKAGKINVLNCSTTMEMGVDIGGVSAVVMNNVPPHPANYLQRAGRAGRRKEERAVAYTLCKPNPHNRRVFANPAWPFTTAIPAPVITLSAEPLVQRHVNSYFLAAFLGAHAGNSGDGTRLNSIWFFGGDPSLCERFQEWLRNDAKNCEQEVRSILRRTALENMSLEELAGESATKIGLIAEMWKSTALRLRERLTTVEDPAFRKALELEQRRHEEEYLLKDLSARAFLPGYGFPNDVVTLNISNIEDFKEKKQRKEHRREDNVFTYKELPSRGLPIAIREYAPGSQVVIDGRVYRSAGVSLSSYRDQGMGHAQQIDLFWQCRRCGEPGFRQFAYSSGNDNVCGQCGTEIGHRDVRTLLRPLGFVTDFYEATNNDVSSQKFIPVQRPMVSVSDQVAQLPDPRCGFLRFGESGRVLHHSSGEHGHGYAVCLGCGRADSMSPTGDLPRQFNPGEMHRAVGGPKAGSTHRDCSAENVKPGLHLGYQAQTHVMEFVLKSPINGTWIGDDDDGRIVAMTLAVALRDSIADGLGVAASEMGFATRVDRDMETGQERRIIQIYDQVAGGAGFAISALEDVTAVMLRAIAALRCSADCDTVCSSCLAGKDSNVEYEQLNRNTALAWVEECRLEDYLQLPDIYRDIQDARHWPHSPGQFAKRLVHQGVDRIVLYLDESVNGWDSAHPAFKSAVLNWILVNGVDVTLVVPSSVTLNNEQSEILADLCRFGIHLATLESAETQPGPRILIQGVDSTGDISTLLNDGVQGLVPSEDWLDSDGLATYAVTSTLHVPAHSELAIDRKGLESESAAVIEINRELNGTVNGFGKRLFSLLADRAPALFGSLDLGEVTRIRYEDRYLRSPWAALLFLSIVSEIKSENLECVEVVTSPGKDHRRPRLLWDDWSRAEPIKATLKTWIEAVCKAEAKVSVYDNPMQVSHRRIFTIETTSKDPLKIVFDQGMGFWRVSSRDDALVQFDFDADLRTQIKHLLACHKDLRLTTNCSWPSDISIYR